MLASLGSSMIKQVQLYDDRLDFEENKAKGPFGNYAKSRAVYKNKGDPKYDFFGTPVFSPFGIAAGPLPTPRFIKAALNQGFDIVTLKSVRTDVFPLNKYPQVRPVSVAGDLDPDSPGVKVAQKYSEPLALANSFGTPSVKPSEWQPPMEQSLSLPQKGQAVLVAFQGTARGRGRDDFVQDHVKGVALVKETGANLIEINLSCPNDGAEVLACFDTDITERIVNAVRDANPDLKFIIKLAYFSNHKQLKQLVKRVGDKLDGISAINTIPVAVVDRKGSEVFPGRLKAGVSGAPIKWAGLEMTKKLKQFREEFGYKYKILGMGGVTDARSFQEYIDAGADTVMSVAGAMWNPNLASEIKQSLTK
jgi:dihydroorotate dehydrogenase (NAD+) catalytic subunit